MYAWYRAVKPICFSSLVAAKVLILGRMLSLVSVAKSPRTRQLVSRMETAGVIFAATIATVACVIMWISTSESFATSDAYARAARADGNTTAVADFLAISKSKLESANAWNAYNGSFETFFYAVYTTASVAMTAVVFRTLRTLLQTIESQKLLLDSLSDPTSRESEEANHASLVAINDIANQKSQQLRIVLRKIALNCCAIVLGSFFGIIYLVIVTFSGLLPSTPPSPPCPAAASKCDECELMTGLSVNKSRLTRCNLHIISQPLLAALGLTRRVAHIKTCHTLLHHTSRVFFSLHSHVSFMQYFNLAVFAMGIPFHGLDLDLLVILITLQSLLPSFCG
jgi:hypothetical protein